MILSIEGIDGAGKTMSIIKLSESLGVPFVDLNTALPPTRCLNVDSWQGACYLIAAMSQSNMDVILDRTTLSYWAYEQRNDSYLEYLEKLIKDVKPFILLFDCDVNTARKRDPESAKLFSYEEMTWQRHRMLASAECFENSGVPVQVIKTGDGYEHNLDKIVPIVRKMIGMEEEKDG